MDTGHSNNDCSKKTAIYCGLSFSKGLENIESFVSKHNKIKSIFRYVEAWFRLSTHVGDDRSERRYNNKRSPNDILNIRLPSHDQVSIILPCYNCYLCCFGLNQPISTYFVDLA